MDLQGSADKPPDTILFSYPVNSSLKGMKMQSKASLSVDKAIPAD
jgi:hypothetical protein